MPAGQQPYQHDPDQARDLLTTAGWPAGRELRPLPPTWRLWPGGRNFTASLGLEVDLTLIPADQLLAAQHALVEKVPLPFDVLVHAWIDLLGRAAGVHAQPVLLRHGRLPGRPRSRSSTNCWGSSPPPPTNGS